MLTKITQKEINDAYNKYCRQYEGRKEDYFALLFLSKKHNLKPEDAAQYITFGGNDYGIDAFYFDEEKRNLYLYQFKWSVDHMLFKDSFQRLIKDGLERVFGNAYQDSKQNQLLIKLRSSLVENRDVINKVFIHFVFNGDPQKAEQSKVLDSLREDLESKTHLINNYFGREVGLNFQYISNQRMVSELVQKKIAHRYEIDCENPLKLQTSENELMIIFIPLSKLFEMYNDLGEKLFSKNIRSGLGEGKATNREIKRSLKKIISEEEPPENFTFYHNGISLTAEQLVPRDGVLLMVEPRILNGAQTVMTLRKFVEENKADNRISEKLHTIKVMARIVKSSQDEFLKKVTINNNRQNPIMPWNLRANDLIQLEFEDKFREELKIYYERRENAFENLTNDDLEQIGITSDRAIEIKKFAQTLLAIQGEVDRMSRISEVFENENYYKDTFKEKYLRVDAKKLILFYKIQYRLPSITREILSKGEDKYYYVTRARNLLWALLVQGLLNDDKFKDYVESYGQSLLIEGNYTALLKDIASKKIRFIFSKTFQKGKYAEYI
ncbi:MAG: AIPR family protein, partial [bacterium]